MLEAKSRPALPVKPLRPAYAQVADQLRDLILRGELKVGDRLPTEPELCAQFGVSRSTIREALKLLASQNLIVTRRGFGGGTDVTAPNPAQLVEFLNTTMTLLAGTGELTAPELTQARRLLEVPAAGLAASRAGDRAHLDIDALRAQIPSNARDCSRQELFDLNHAFHQTIVAATGNRVLMLMNEPIFTILQRRFLGTRATPEFHQQIIVEHHDILEAIAGGDAGEAERAMDGHLCRLEPTYLRDDRMAES